MSSPSPDRRSIFALLAALPALAAAPKPKVVTILGDSITAGYGLERAQAFPNQLHLALQKLGVANVVRGSGVSGDTTAAGLARIGFSVKSDTDLAIVALGGNDLLQGLDPKTTRANLDRIVAHLQGRKLRVLLAGLAAPPVVGAGYVRDFQAVFPAVAKAHGVELYPDLLAGVGRDRRYLQNDSIHPNAAGAKIIAARLAPVVKAALARPG